MIIILTLYKHVIFNHNSSITVVIEDPMRQPLTYRYLMISEDFHELIKRKSEDFQVIVKSIVAHNKSIMDLLSKRREFYGNMIEQEEESVELEFEQGFVEEV